LVFGRAERRANAVVAPNARAVKFVDYFVSGVPLMLPPVWRVAA
jgi:hypothetical protein